MELYSRLLSMVGDLLVRTALRATRRMLGVRAEAHRDRRGRVTPYLVLGEPRAGTLVFLHGFGDRTDQFLRTAAGLRDRYRIIIPAMPGFGDGWVDPGERHTWTAYGEWLGEILDDIAPGPVHLMGNSLGGSTALLINAAKPQRVESLVLIDAAGIRVNSVHSGYEKIEVGHNLFEVRDRAAHERFLKRIFAQPPRMPRPVQEYLFRENLRNASWYARIMADFGTGFQFVSGELSSVVDLSAIRVPTLVVWGEHDSLFPLPIGECAASIIPGAELRIMRGVGHCPHLEQPKELASVFDDFVRRLGSARAEPERTTP